MTQSRSHYLGWPSELINIGSWRQSVSRNEAVREPRMLHSCRRAAASSGFLVFLGHYMLGEDGEAERAAHEYLRHAEEYFFGAWKDEAPTGNASDRPPDREYWHQRWAQDDPFVQAITVASILGEWDLVRRLAHYMATIDWPRLEFPNKPRLRWIDVRDKREESAWRLTLAGVLDGRKLEDDLKPLVDIVTGGRARREKLLLTFLRAIEVQNGEELQRACDAYFGYHRKVESEKDYITSKVAIEGTFLVNLARRQGRRLVLPEEAGARFIELKRPRSQ